MGTIPRSVRQVQGLRKVMVNLNRAILNIKGRSLEGLIRSAAMIRNETEKTSPITPLDLGNLRASFFIVSIKGTEPDVMGYSGKFKGRKGGVPVAKLKSDHQDAIMEAQGLVKVIKDPVVIFGYSANYAMYVHEMIGANFKRPGAGPKWFETHVKKNKDEIIRITAKYAKIP